MHVEFTIKQGYIGNKNMNKFNSRKIHQRFQRSLSSTVEIDCLAVAPTQTQGRTAIHAHVVVWP